MLLNMEWKICGLIVVALVAALLSGEVIFRIRGAAEKNTKIKIQKKGQKSYRILCVGDSSVAGVGASDLKKFSYPGQLQKLLNENAPKQKFEVINIGRGGISSSQVLNNFRRNLSEYKPDLVIMMVGINDPWNLEDSNILKFYNVSLFKKLYLNVELLLLRKSRLYQSLKLARLADKFKNQKGDPGATTYIPEDKLKIPAFNDAARDKAFQFDVSMGNITRAGAIYHAINYNITALKMIAEENNADIIFLKYHVGGLGQPQEIIHATYATLGVPIVDLQSLFKKVREMGLNISSADGWHLNDLGYLLMARKVYNELVALEVAEGKPVEIYVWESETHPWK